MCEITQRATRYLDALPSAPAMYAQDTPAAIVRDCLTLIEGEVSDAEKLEYAVDELHEARLERDQFEYRADSFRETFERLAKALRFESAKFDPTNPAHVDELIEHAETLVDAEAQ